MSTILKALLPLLLAPLLMHSQTHIKEVIRIEYKGYLDLKTIGYYSFNEYFGEQIKRSYHYSNHSLSITNYSYISSDTSIEVEYLLKSKNNEYYDAIITLDSGRTNIRIDYHSFDTDENPCLTLVHQEPLLYNLNTILACEFDTVSIDTTRKIYNSYQSIIAEQIWTENGFKTYKTVTFDEDNNKLRYADWEYTTNHTFSNGKEISSNFTYGKDSDTSYSIRLYPDSNKVILCSMEDNDSLLQEINHFKNDVLRASYYFPNSTTSWNINYLDSISYNWIPDRIYKFYNEEGEIIKKEKWENGILEETYTYEYTNVQDGAIRYKKCYENDKLISMVLIRKYDVH